MITWQDHLDAIARAPEDDGPRLVPFHAAFAQPFISERGVRSKALANVEVLDLSNCALSHEAIDALMRSPHRGSLKHLRLNENPLEVTSKAALPGVQVENRVTEPWDQALFRPRIRLRQCK